MKKEAEPLVPESEDQLGNRNDDSLIIKQVAACFIVAMVIAAFLWFFC